MHFGLATKLIGPLIRRLGTMSELLVPTMHPVRDKVLRALGSVRPLSRAELASRRVSGHTLVSSAMLPPQHFIYFALVELLGFADLGQEEKVAGLFQWKSMEFHSSLHS